MAITVNLWQRFEIVDGNGVVHAGGRLSSEQPRTITATNGEIFEQTLTVAALTAVKLFDVAQDLADFSFLYVESSQTGLVQLVNHSSANFFTVEVAANGIFILGGDASQYGGSVGAFDGTADDIEQVFLKNTHATLASVVRIVAAR